mmetsp:Transcript_26367/g.39947  ORF Transcript_26367/g.39947 Transcript_26367/m.39947 type:complete len:470 (+) Transcript_26367:150-1559(+)
MNTPLLATDQPSLSSPEVIDPDSNSHLTQMLRGASSPPFLSHPALSSFRPFSRRTPSSSASMPMEKISFITIFVTSLVIIYAVLLWASFLSTEWIKEHLYVNVSFLPPVDILVCSMDLGSLISVFQSTSNSLVVLTFAITTVAIPCLNVVIQPLMIIGRHHAFLSGTSYTAKSFVNNLTRFGFLIVYSFIIFDISTSAVVVSWENTKIDVATEIGNGFLTFTISLTIVLVTIMTLQLCPVYDTWNLTDQVIDQSNVNQYMRILEEEEIETTGENSQDEVAVPSPERPSLPAYYNLAMFEAALISLLSFVAALAMPLADITYGGISAGLLNKTTYSISLAEIAMGKTTGSTTLLGQGLFIAQIFLSPAFALLMAVYCWFGSHKRWLRAIHPFVNGTTFVVAILMVVPALQSITESILNCDISGLSLCQQIKAATGEPCISIHGSIGAGTWCLLSHALSLEIFILLVNYKL